MPFLENSSSIFGTLAHCTVRWCLGFLFVAVLLFSTGSFHWNEPISDIHFSLGLQHPLLCLGFTLDFSAVVFLKWMPRLQAPEMSWGSFWGASGCFWQSRQHCTLQNLQRYSSDQAANWLKLHSCGCAANRDQGCRESWLGCGSSGAMERLLQHLPDDPEPIHNCCCSCFRSPASTILCHADFPREASVTSACVWGSLASLQSLFYFICPGSPTSQLAVSNPTPSAWNIVVLSITHD